VDFFDEDDPAESDEPRARDSSRGRNRRGAAPAVESGARPTRQQIRTRQLTFAGIAIVVFILLVLAVRGCLDARKERSFKNYVSDLSALTVETKQLSDQFFGALNGSNEDSLDLESQVNGDRGTAQGLYDRAQGLDAPDEVAEEQTEVVLAYRLRRDALDEIADQLPTALGNKGSNKATKEIAEQMKVFVASDVLYRRAQEGIEGELNDQEIVVDGGVPESVFLPTGNKDPDYLNADEVGALLSGAGGSSTGGGGGSGADCDPGDGLTHGLGLVSTTAQPSGAALQPGATTAVTADGLEFAVEVQNQGEAPESNIKVTLGGDFSGTQTISNLASQETTSVTVVPKSVPSAGSAASLTVTVDTVCGEQVSENNESTYELTLE
jgi:hypothetical protein